MWAFGMLCDEFHVATRLFLKLELSPSRETLLHFCEQLRRAFPGMTRFRRRDDGAVILDEGEGNQGGRRYLRVDVRALRFGQSSPPDRSAVSRFAGIVLSQAPYQLSLSDLDYESIEVAYGFDLDYSGNHDELVADALLGNNPLQSVLLGEGRRVIDCQPCVGVALNEDCTVQAYVEVRGRTSMYELRSGEYESQPLSVYLTMRRDFREGAPGELPAIHQELLESGEELATTRVVPQIVRRLQEAIASRR